MLSAAQLDVLRHAADRDPAAAPARAHLSAIGEVLGDALPALERSVRETLRGCDPLPAAAAHLVAAGGKRVRPMATFLCAAACGAEPGRAVPLAAAAELVHSATLLHDDVIDEGEIRRGRPATRVVWGNLVSVLAGDLLLVRALALVESACLPGAMDDLLGTLEALIDGEVRQLHARGREDLGADGWLEVVRGKTASLFAFACRAGARAAGARPAIVHSLGRFGEDVGIAFQIVDDVIDLAGDPALAGKRLGADLAEGKTTLPLALALADDAPALRGLLASARGGDADAARAIAAAPSVRHACVRARAVAAERTASALAALGALPPSRARELLAALVADLVDRKA